MKFNDYFPKAVLLNLDKRTDRLEQFDKQAKELGIAYERISGAETVNPIFGSCLSHIAALSKYESDVIFVFEDDALFVEDFEVKFKQAMENVPDDWDMLYLGAHLLHKEPYNHYWVRSLECSSTHAYAVRGPLKERLVKMALEDKLKHHIDVTYSTIHREIKAYAARPTLAYQGKSYSDLLKQEVDYTYLYF